MSRTWEALRKAEAESIPRRPVDHRGPIEGAAVSPSAPAAAHLEYERIRVWLRYPGNPKKRLRTLMVVASHSGAGGTTTAALLATTLAESRNLRVLVVESNWRTPRMGRVFHVPNGREVPYATDAASLESRISPSDRPNLFVLPAPSGTESPRRPYEDETLDEVLEAAKQRFDLVILDASPIGTFPDALAMASKVDGVILVTESEKTRLDEARRAKHDLERAGARIIGVVVNRYVDYVPRFVRRAFESR
jgi:capsular exopolysaccharide synthesis family protein